MRATARFENLEERMEIGEGGGGVLREGIKQGANLYL